MLRIKHTHHLSLPHLNLGSSHVMTLSPVPADDDELSQAIRDYSVEHDNNWQLTDTPDTEELEQFWTNVAEEVKNDPDWITFSDDNASDWVGFTKA